MLSAIHKVSANYIYTGKGNWLRNGIIYYNDQNEIVDLIDTKGILNESSGLAFFNGLIIPGWFFLSVTPPLFTGEKSENSTRFPTLQKGGCRYIVSFRDQYDTLLTDSKTTIPEHIIYQLQSDTAYPDLFVVNKQHFTLSLYFGPHGNVLRVIFNKAVDRGTMTTLVKTAETLNAKLLFRGDIHILSQISQQHPPHAVFYEISTDQLLISEEYGNLLTSEMIRQGCLFITADFLSKPFKPGVLFSQILHICPSLTFETLIKWITGNPSRLFGLDHHTGYITTGAMPYLVLITPFDFEKRRLMSESRFIYLG